MEKIPTAREVGMLKMVGNALLSLVMDKKGRDRLQQGHRTTAATGREGRIQDLEETAGRVMTPERQELIRQAMAVQRAKTKIFEDLKDEDKQKLYALAVKTLLREGRETDDDSK